MINLATMGNSIAEPPTKPVYRILDEKKQLVTPKPPLTCFFRSKCNSVNSSWLLWLIWQRAWQNLLRRPCTYRPRPFFSKKRCAWRAPGLEPLGAFLILFSFNGFLKLTKLRDQRNKSATNIPRRKYFMKKSLGRRRRRRRRQPDATPRPKEFPLDSHGALYDRKPSFN